MTKAIIAFMLALPLSALRTWVVTVLMGWFVYPFFGITPIPFVVVWGMLVIFSFLVVQKPKAEETSVLDAVLFSVISSLMFLLYGFIIQLFI